MSWNDLPPGAQHKVLSFVPLIARLRTCSLVNRTMYEAAAAATQQLHLELNERAGRNESLEEWLTRHGQQLTSLQLKNATVLLQVPCPQLQQLHLRTCDVLLDPSSSCAYSTRLTKLVLDECYFQEDVIQLAGALKVMNHLQHLELLCPSPETLDGHNLPSAVLQHLPQLTHLSLVGHGPYCCITAPALYHISTLKHLQELCLIGDIVGNTRSLSLSLSPSTTPGISCLTAFTRLELHFAELDVAVLQPLTKLRKLGLHHMTAPVCGMAALLKYVSQLVLLQDLVWSGEPCPVAGAGPAKAWAGLTASSNLQNLEVVPVFSDYDGLWPHLFPAGRKLQHCTSVRLSSPAATAALGSSDITSLVSCCPSLRRVAVFVKPDAALMPLTQLTALTELSLGHPLGRSWADCQGCIQSVAALTGLRSLELFDRGTELQLQDYLPLTRLQQLTLLRLDCMPDVASFLNIRRWAAGEGEPQVWEQLLQEIVSLESLTLGA